MPTSSSFSRPVIIESSSPGRLQAIGGVREAAEIFLREWPLAGRGPRYLAALEFCHEALAGEVEIEEARHAFVEAAKEAGTFVREGR